MDYLENHAEKSAYLITVMAYRDHRDIVFSYITDRLRGVRLLVGGHRLENEGPGVFVIVSTSWAEKIAEEMVRIFTRPTGTQQMQSVFVAKFDPENRGGYLHPDEWERVKSLTDTMSTAPASP